MSMPYRIETPRLVLRCYQPADAALLAAAVDASLAHLQVWMPWVESTSLSAKIERLRRMRGDFDLDRDYSFGIFSPDERELFGSIGLHARVGPGAFEIGYWLHVDHCGRGYATEAAAALTRVAFDCIGSDRVEMHCDPANTASLGVPQRLGYTHTETLVGLEGSFSGTLHDAMIWVMHAESAGSLEPPLKLFDAAGAPWSPEPAAGS